MNKTTKIIGILPLFSVLFCVSCNKTTKTDWESYQEILSDCKADRDFHTELLVFPESIEGAEITKFVFSTTSDLFTGSWLMYLGVIWDETTFSNELSRLDEVKTDFRNGEEKHIIKYEEEQLYLSISRNNRYEYVLYDQTKLEIIYISNQLYPWKEIPVEPEHVLPNITIPSELDDGGNSYNMYYFYEGDVGIESVD